MREPILTVTFSHDQALVLSDWLYRVIGSPAFDSFVADDPSVWSSLYQLDGALETTVPEIFAADYGERLGAARRRLLDGPSRPIRRPRPTSMVADATESTERTIENWIREDNVMATLEHLSSLIGYPYDGADEDALIGALDETDDETDRWFEYPLCGSQVLTVRLAQAVGGAVVSIQVSGVMDEVLAARVETVLDLL
ncbi:hypothetical protein [Hamadaea sp.]|uniref:hypothetical protein n=1 Tax=Hamadaea sp. TaxID=2024425 RepID=UPI0025BAFA8C|nr:hypothetical protein [Hamadaea sp.]